MANKPLNTELLDRAIIFAVHAHAGTERRGKGYPYIVHPMEAVEIVATMTADQELLAAAALHDTVEDTEVTVEQIRSDSRKYEEAFTRNYQRWNNMADKSAIDYDLNREAFACKNEAESAEQLAHWLEKRIAFMNEVWHK